MGVRRLGTSKRVEKQKTKIYWVGGWDIMGRGWRQGANIGARVLLGSPKTFNLFKKMCKICKKRIRIC